MFEDLGYIKIMAYWDDLLITGILPILTVAFLNLQTYLNVSRVRQLHTCIKTLFEGLEK